MPKPTPIKLQSRVPMPLRRFALTGNQAELRKAIAKMKPGQSFPWHCNKDAYRAAQAVGIKITTRKIDGEGFRAWRVE